MCGSTVSCRHAQTAATTAHCLIKLLPGERYANPAETLGELPNACRHKSKEETRSDQFGLFALVGYRAQLGTKTRKFANSILTAPRLASPPTPPPLGTLRASQRRQQDDVAQLIGFH
jgi:hypothetical protein